MATDSNTSSDMSMRDLICDFVRDEEQIDTVTWQYWEDRKLKQRLKVGVKWGYNNGNVISIEDEDVNKYVAVYYTDPNPTIAGVKSGKCFPTMKKVLWTR